jgi:hypothetical protein
MASLKDIEETVGKLVQLGHTLFATKSAYYGVKYRDDTRRFLSRIHKPLDRVESLLGLTGHVFILKPLSSKYNGFTLPHLSAAMLDPRRRTFEEFVYTFCHECLHLKQIQDGRMQVRDNTLYWDGKKYDGMEVPDFSNEVSVLQYYMTPWETDAIAKETQVYCHAMQTKRIPFEHRKMSHVRH